MQIGFNENNLQEPSTSVFWEKIRKYHELAVCLNGSENIKGYTARHKCPDIANEFHHASRKVPLFCLKGC